VQLHLRRRRLIFKYNALVIPMKSGPIPTQSGSFFIKKRSCHPDEAKTYAEGVFRKVIATYLTDILYLAIPFGPTRSMSNKSSIFQSLDKLREWTDRDPNRVALDAAKYPELPVREIATQLKLRRKAISKFPSWSGKDLLYTERALEQSSGEIAAQHKHNWLKGRVIDLSGGLGSDLIHSADQINFMAYCDINADLCDLFRHNTSVLGIFPDAIHHGDGIEILKNYPDDFFDIVYVDPDRRMGKGRTVSLKEASPDISNHLDLILSKGKLLLVKASPALDPTEAERQIPGLSEYHVVSVDAEVKEVLLLVCREKKDRVIRSASVIKGDQYIHLTDEGIRSTNWKGDVPVIFCEPDPAIIRAELCSELAAKHDVFHISPSSVYLVGDEKPENFPGRVFRVMEVIPANFRSVKDWCKANSYTKANIARREFPEDPESIRKALKLKDGGDLYLFFTKHKGNYACLACVK